MALHELAHWTGAEKRPNRFNDDTLRRFTIEDYAREELRADISSFFTAGDIGISNELEKHPACVEYRIKALKEDKNEIFRAARDAEKITGYVLAFKKEKALNHEKPTAEKEAYALKQNPPVAAETDVRLIVDYKERREAKELGSKRDKNLKTWYAPKERRYRFHAVSKFFGIQALRRRNGIRALIK